MIEFLKELDRDLFIFLNNLGVEQYDHFWIFVTQIDTWIPLFVLFFILMFYYHGAKKGFILVFFTILTFAVALTLTNLTKDFVGRLRPNNVEALNTLIRALQKPTNFSFFSGHAASSFALTTFVVLALKKHTKWIYLVYIWPIIFVTSRIYVGVHYPSDILVGAGVGTLVALLMHLIYRRLVK